MNTAMMSPCQRRPARWMLAFASALLLPSAWASGQMVLLPDDRVIIGTVVDLRSDEVKVDTGEVEPRYLSSKQAQEKGIWPLVKGDRLQIVVNEQNMVLGYHRLGEMGVHQIIRGRLAEPLVVGQESAVIQPDGKSEQTFPVRPLVRSKLAAVPIGLPAAFLIDETGQIMDVAFGGEDTLRAATKGWAGSTPKGVNRQVRGTLVKPLAGNQVVVRTEDGREQALEVRDLLRDKFQTLSVGKQVILLLDNEDKVTDLAIP